MPAGAELRVGSKSKAVEALRERLVASGDLDPVAGMGPVFDSFVEAAVKRFQARNGLSQTGVVNEATFAELNVPAAARLQQLETNIVRLKAYSGDLGARYVVVNIPAASVETVENGVVYSHHAAGVGKIDRQSPIMQTKATEINFNPFWTVPPSLIKKDLIPKMKADPNYLTDEKIRVFNKDGQEVSSGLDRLEQQRGDQLSNTARTRAPTSIRSASCASTFPTPTASTCMTRRRRAFSATTSASCRRAACGCRTCAIMSPGCLKDTPGWGRDQIDAVIRSGERLDVKLAQPVNVYWVYVTAWATPDGIVQFRPDVYQRDGAGPGPLASAVPAQPLALPQE